MRAQSIPYSPKAKTVALVSMAGEVFPGSGQPGKTAFLVANTQLRPLGHVRAMQIHRRPEPMATWGVDAAGGMGLCLRARLRPTRPAIGAPRRSHLHAAGPLSTRVRRRLRVDWE